MLVARPRVAYRFPFMGNIGPVESRKRLVFGFVALGAAGAILAGLVVAGADRWYRAVIAVPLFISILGLFQAREKT